MRTHLLFLLTAVLSCSLCLERNALSAGKPGLFPNETIEVNGKPREYRLVVPDSLDLKNPAPLVFAFHGLGDSKDMMPKYTGLDDLAAKEGFILVYPNGPNRDWPIAFAHLNGELDFFDALCKRIEESYNVDADRIYLTGMSNGAIFVNLLASQRSEKIAAIAPHSGSLGALAIRGIKAKRKYPVMMIHGEDDKIIPVAAARRSADVYRKEGHEVELILVPGMGHSWAHEVDVNDKMWAFFKAHPVFLRMGRPDSRP